jgi:hypothetical protein
VAPSIMENLVINFVSINTKEVRRLQNGGLDANGQVPEMTVSDGAVNPCRHCLETIDEGEEMLILAHRPFAELQPYAETGPIFLHAKECTAYRDSNNTETPAVLKTSSQYLLRGYDENERIVYGTGCIMPNEEIASQAETLFGNHKVKFIHVRSASNNCYQARIERS